jgi:hypothetical protein
MMPPFNPTETDAWLQAVAVAYGGIFNANGGFRMRGSCTYDSYAAVDNGRNYRASIAVRQPKDGEVYFAVRRKAANRNIVEDRISFSRREIALAHFVSAVSIVRLGDSVKTLGMVEQPEVDLP